MIKNVKRKNKWQLALSKQHKLTVRKQEYQRLAGKYIYRLDDAAKGHGWYLKIDLGSQNVINKKFPDSKFGSPIKALKEAKIVRDSILEKHNVPLAAGRHIQAKPRSTNRTGVTGVCRSGDYYYAHIYIEPNRKKTKKYSIEKYSDYMAFKMAVEWRMEMEKEVYGGTFVNESNVLGQNQSDTKYK